MSIGEYTDRVPEEASETHESLVLDVHVAFALEVQFETPPTDLEWVEALRRGIMERVSDPSWVGLGNDDIIEWAVVDVEGRVPKTLEEYIEELIDQAARGMAGPAEWHANDVRELVKKEQA